MRTELIKLFIRLFSCNTVIDDNAFYIDRLKTDLKDTFEFPVKIEYPTFATHNHQGRRVVAFDLTFQSSHLLDNIPVQLSYLFITKNMNEPERDYIMTRGIID